MDDLALDVFLTHLESRWLTPKWCVKLYLWIEIDLTLE